MRAAPLTVSGVSLMLKRVAQKAGIEKPVYPHLFRHTRITDWMKQGKDPRRIKMISGHSSHAFDVYVHYSAKDAIDMVYPEFAENLEFKPLIAKPKQILPDPTLREQVFEVVEQLMPRILKELSDYQAKDADEDSL